MRRAETYTRETVGAAKGHMARTAERLLDSYPGATQVTIVRRGSSGTVSPVPREILHVAATSGKWARSAENRMGAGVGKATWEIEIDLRITAERKARAETIEAGYRKALDVLIARGFESLLRSQLFERVPGWESAEWRDAVVVMEDALAEAGCERNVNGLAGLLVVEFLGGGKTTCPAHRLLSERHEA